MEMIKKQNPNTTCNCVRGIVLKETEKAYLLMLDANREKWIPKSQTSNIQIGRSDQEITCIVPDWLYNKTYGIIIKSTYDKPVGFYDEYDAYDDDQVDSILGTFFDQC